MPSPETTRVNQPATRSDAERGAIAEQAASQTTAAKRAKPIYQTATGWAHIKDQTARWESKVEAELDYRARREIENAKR